MKYLEFTFTTSPSGEVVCDVLSAVLAEVGFESFVHTDCLDLPRVAMDDGFPEAPVFAEKADSDQYKAYIRTDLFDEAKFHAALAAFPLPDVEIHYRKEEAEDKNWNEEWEKNYFQPLIIGDGECPRCVIASTFHKNVPLAEYQILINPQMSFGTGHHQTTAQMIARLLDEEVRGRVVLDMGCGTGILAILARRRGAARCVAVDYDEWCVRNTLDNIALNRVDEIEVVHGDAGVLASYSNVFDLIVANINRNILLADLPRYVPTLKRGGWLYVSGFYSDDTPKICDCAERLGLECTDVRTLDRWDCVKFVKL